MLTIAYSSLFVDFREKSKRSWEEKGNGTDGKRNGSKAVGWERRGGQVDGGEVCERSGSNEGYRREKTEEWYKVGLRAAPGR